MFGVRVRFRVSVRVTSLRDSFSVLVRPQHHSVVLLTTAGRVHTSKNYSIHDLCILTEKIFGVGSSNFGFVHLDNWATH